MKTNRRRGISALLATITTLAVGTAGCSSGDAGAGKADDSTLRVGHAQPIDNWDPLLQSTPTYLFLVYDTLFEIGPDGKKFTPSLATDWKLTPNALTMKLRHGVRFQDGTPFTANSVVTNLKHSMGETSQYSTVLDNFKKVAAHGRYAVRIDLKRPQPNLLRYLSMQLGVMVSPKALKNGSFKTAPVGTGPFKYNSKESVPGSITVVDKYTKYWNAKDVDAEKIVYKNIESSQQRYNALRTGQVDVIQETTGRVAKQAKKAGFEIYNVPATVWALTFFDTEGVFANPLVRKAVCHAISPQDWIDAAFNGIGTVHAVNQAAFGSKTGIPRYKHDLAKAKSLMKKAGSPKISFSVAASSEFKTVYKLFKSEVAPLGIKVNLNTMPFGQYSTDYVKRKYPMSIFSVLGIQPFGYYNYTFSSQAIKNPFNNDYSELDSLAHDASRQPAAKAERTWEKFARNVHDNAFECGYMGLTTTWIYDKTKVAELSGTPYVIDTLRYTDIKLTEGG